MAKIIGNKIGRCTGTAIYAEGYDVVVNYNEIQSAKHGIIVKELKPLMEQSGLPDVEQKPLIELIERLEKADLKELRELLISLKGEPGEKRSEIIKKSSFVEKVSKSAPLASITSSLFSLSANENVHAAIQLITKLVGDLADKAI